MLVWVWWFVSRILDKTKCAVLTNDTCQLTFKSDWKKEKETLNIPKEPVDAQKVVPTPPDVAIANNGIVTPLPIQQPLQPLPVQPVTTMPVSTIGGAQMQPQANI